MIGPMEYPHTLFATSGSRHGPEGQAGGVTELNKQQRAEEGEGGGGKRRGEGEGGRGSACTRPQSPEKGTSSWEEGAMHMGGSLKASGQL